MDATHERPRPAFCRLLALALVVPAAACALDAKVPPAQAPTQAAWRAAQAADAAAPAPAWWRSFGAPELDALAEAALAGNLDIAAAVARIEQADAQARVAGAPLLPALDLSTSASRSRAGGGSGSSRTANRYGLTLSASYEIDFWGKNRAGQRAAEWAAAASRYDRETVALSVAAGVAGAYLQILAAQDRLETARGNLAIAQRALDAIRARNTVGTATALDVAQQESIVLQQRAAVPPLQQQIRQNANALAILAGRPPADLDVAGGGLRKVTVPAVAAGLPSELLTRRPDIRRAEAQLRAAEADVVAARAALFPSIELTAAGGYQSAALGTLFGPGAALWSLAAGLTQPLFDGGRLEGQLEAQRARYVELLQSYRQAILSAFRDVEDALVAIEQTAQQETLQLAVVASARRAYDISAARLREGTIDLLTLLNTQQTLFQAQDQLAQIRLARLQAVVGLYQALGGGWDGTLPGAPVPQ
ncbi:MAG: efflux transporter outer membrane subunit [Alphaproteobacteria bacterium]|nr:efflux transporter outer membrane subunit [Alphaproteobacteria bacterium]